MRQRLIAESDREVVSSFSSLQMAEWALSKVMQSNSTTVKAWLQSSSRVPLVLRDNVGKHVGYGVVRESGKLVQMSKVRIVLKCERYNGMPYYIFTSYLER